MFEFTLKFLTGESRKYEVDESESVRQFKERLRDELNIPIERQRLIFQGKVLQDETKLIDSNIQNKTVHFVERAEPPPPQNTNNGFGGVASGTADMSQSMLDEVNETTSVFINAFPGSMNLNSNDVQSLVQNLLNDLGDVGRQARVNTTMTSDGQGVDIQIDFGNVAQYLQQHELRERFRSIGRMMTRLRSRLDRLEQLIESNFRLPTSTAENSEQQNQTNDADASTSSSTGPEDITSEMDTDDSQTSTPQTNAQSTTASNEASAPVTTHTARELAELMNSVDAEQRRLNNHFQEYMRTITRTESFGEELAGRRRFFSLYNESLHLISHIYHNITDFSVDLEEPLETRAIHLGEPTNLGSPNMMGPVHNATATDQNMSAVHRLPRLNSRRPTAVATARIMGPVSFGAGQMGFRPQTPQGGVHFHPASMGVRQVPETVPNNAEQSSSTPLTSTMPATASGMQPMTFNLGVPWTFVEMGPTGITLNQVSAQVVADVQTSDGTSSMPTEIPHLTNLSGMPNLNNLPGMANLNNLPGMANLNNLPGMANLNNLPGMANLNNLPGMPNLSNLPANATVIMGQRATDANGQPGPIQINGGAFDNNFAASIAQRVQEHFAQLAGQTAAGVASGSTNVSFSTQIPSNDNNQSLNAAASTSATNERSQAHARYVPSGTLTVNPLTGRLVLDGSSRSRSADSRPASSSSATTQSPTGSPSQQATNFTMMTSHDNPLQGRMMIPGQRTTILQSVDRSLPCTSRYFSHTIRSRQDGSGAFGPDRGRNVFIRRGRHRHPAGHGRYIYQQPPQQQTHPSGTSNDFIMSSAGMPPSAESMFSSNSGQSFVTAHTFEIPMIISASTDISQQPQVSSQEQPSATSSSPDNQQTQAQPTNNQQNAETQQAQNTILSQVLSQILPGVLRSGTGRIRLNIGQMNANGAAPQMSVGNSMNSTPSANTTPRAASASTSTSGTNANPATATNETQNSLGLDFTGIARSIGSIVQEITGRLTGTTFGAPNPTESSPSVSSTTTSTSSTTSTNTSSSTSRTTPTQDDTITGQMLTELVRLFGNGPENPELNNLTIGTFMQRFGEDADSRNSDGTSLVSELFSVMTSQMRFSDVWNLVLGNPIVGTRFSAARHSATDYLQNTLLQGRPITPETIDELCAQLYQSLIQEASIDFNELPVKPHINLKNVMKRFFMHHGRAILNIIFHDDDNVWFDHFRQQLICLRNEYLALASHCFEGGESAAIEYLLNRHRAIFRSTNQMILTWSETYLRTCLTNAFSSIRSSPPNILTYLNEPPTSNQLPQEHHNGVTLSTPVNTIPQTSTIASKTGNERQEQKLTMTTASQENTNWQADLPEDWIPIVIGDVAVQTHVQPQPPFSNAYKDGIPAKRRRVHNREDLTSTNLLNNILIRAAQSSNTQSQLPDSDSLRHMASSPEVLQTFEQELKRLLELRLKNDRDYEKIHTRMPNTKRYLEE